MRLRSEVFPVSGDLLKLQALQPGYLHLSGPPEAGAGPFMLNCYNHFHRLRSSPHGDPVLGREIHPIALFNVIGLQELIELLQRHIRALVAAGMRIRQC